MTSNTEQPVPATAATAEPKPTKKANVGKRARSVAATKVKPGKQAGPARKVQKRRTKAKVANTAKPEARTGSKTAKILDLLKRPGGATAQELQRATGRRPHSIRGFLSGTIGKKMGLAITSNKVEGGERKYAVK